MAPLPADSSARVKIKYLVCEREHELLIRFKAPATVDDVLAGFSSLIAGVDDLLFLSEFISAEVADVGSNIFNPDSSVWPVSWGTGAGSLPSTADFIDFVGRSLDGRKTHLALFGAKTSVSGDGYRISSASNSVINGMTTVLNAASNIFTTINGFHTVWQLYANIGQNAYWRNHLR